MRRLWAGGFLIPPWLLIRAEGPKTAVEAAKIEPKKTALPKAKFDAPLQVKGDEFLNGIAKAANLYDGAPTLEELSRELVKTAKIDGGRPTVTVTEGRILKGHTDVVTSVAFSPDGRRIASASSDKTIRLWDIKEQKTTPLKISPHHYGHRLAALSGLPHGLPLRLFGRDGKDGTVWSKLALAIARIERPGREPKYSDLHKLANEALSSQSEPNLVYRIAAKLPQYLPDAKSLDSNSKSIPIELIATVQDKWFAAETEQSESKPIPGERLHEAVIHRALAIASDTDFRHVYLDAPWLPHLEPSEMPKAPAWVAPAAAFIPLALALIWLASSMAFRKAYLRRRPPQLPPVHLDLVARAKLQVSRGNNIYRQIAQRLQIRTPTPTTLLNIRETIQATVAQGGEMIVPVMLEDRHMPEYLVLVEQKSGLDQDAERLKTMVSHLTEIVPVTIFHFKSEPSVLQPDKPGARAVSIEYLQAAYPDHRLLILGSGAEFLDPVTLKPRPSALKLMHWPRRALLTPLALAEWGHEEFTLAHELQMPLGRATSLGLLKLAELLGLEGSEQSDLIDTSGDDLARPLPEIMRLRPQKFLYDAPPDEMPIDDIIRSLRNFLDGPGFEWLCALAVYPAVQWDLTLYLGASLGERRGDVSEIKPIYDEARIAALTQLPWLRDGHMPNWLRRALIEEMHPGRAAEVHRVLKRLIDEARLSGDPARDEAVRLRISQEAAKEHIKPDELYEDEVLLDFLSKSEREDFQLDDRNWIERFLPRTLWERLGIPELGTAIAAFAYAAAAYWLAPKAADGALITGAWWPLVLLATGAVFALIVSMPGEAYRIVRGGLVRLAPFALAIAVTTFLWGLWLEYILSLSDFAVGINLIGEGLAYFLNILFLSVISYLISWRISQWLWIPTTQIEWSSLRGMAQIFRRIFMIALISFVLSELSGADVVSASWIYQPSFHLINNLGFTLFLLGWFAARVLPRTLPPPRSKTPLVPHWAMDRARFALALFPILLAAVAANHLGNVHEKLKLAPGHLPGTKQAFAQTRA